MKYHGSKPKEITAILSVFPTYKSFQDFKGETGTKNIITSLVAFAANMGIIQRNDPDLFEAFIRSNSLQPSDCEPPQQLTLNTRFSFFDLRPIAL